MRVTELVDTGRPVEQDYGALLRRKGSSQMRRSTWGVVATAALIIGMIATASSATAETSGSQSFTVFAAGPPGTPRTVVATGVINGVGTVLQGPSGPNQANPTWMFPDGSLSVRLNYVSENVSNEAACIFTSNLTGTWNITSGTGRFAGAAGSGTFSGPNIRILLRTPDGCDGPLAQFTLFQYSGAVSVPGALAA